MKKYLQMLLNVFWGIKPPLAEKYCLIPNFPRQWLYKGQLHQGFPSGSDSKDSACNAGDLGSILGLGRSPGGRNSHPLQHSGLENPHGQRSLAGNSPGEQSQTRLSDFHFTHTSLYYYYYYLQIKSTLSVLL